MLYTKNIKNALDKILRLYEKNSTIRMDDQR